MTAQEFIFKTAPYKRVDGDEFVQLHKELSNDYLHVDGFNPNHNMETTYHLCSASIKYNRSTLDSGGFLPFDYNIRVLSFKCGRFNDILSLIVYCDKKEGYIIKIGSYPSLRDFHKDDIKRYDRVLSPTQRTELITAIMIANNGVGIGSYVYLRRIFEGIVFEEAQNAIKDGVISEEDFNNKRMDEKIVSIKEYLPSFLYEHHKELYGILSKGIHQLDEDVCLAIFPVLYDCIILILEDRLAQKEKEETTKKAAAALSKIASNL